MSFFALNTAGNALQAYTEALDVTSNNISDVDVSGASRQVAQITEAPPITGAPGAPSNLINPGTLGEGSAVDKIQRIHDDSFDGLFRGATSSANFFTTEQGQLTNLQSQFGEPDNGVNAAFTTLQTSLSDLASSPTSSDVRSSVISAAQGFVTALNQSGQAIQNQEQTVLTQATSVVTQANTLIDGIAQLNGEIRAQTAVGNNPNTYLDERDEDIDQLSQLISVTTSIQADGSTLVTVNGQALVNDTQAYTLAAPVIGTAANGTAEFKIGFANDPNPTNPSPVPLGSGQLAAYADLYNNKLIPYGQELDNFANASAGEINRITESGYDINGNAGTALLEPIVSQDAISAANIQVGISDPTQVVAGFVSTAAITNPALAPTAVNSANNTVDTSAALDANQTLNNPVPAAGLTGTLTVTVNGVAQVYNYDTNTTDSSIDSFIANFNAAQLGVTASYSTTGQTIVFTLNPNNSSLAARAAQAAAGAPTQPTFSITDSNKPPATQPQGVNATSLLQALGASGIDGVLLNSGNAFGSSDNSAANALVQLFTLPVGIGTVQTTIGNAGGIPAGTVTVAPPTPGAYSTIEVGQELTIGAGTASQENVTVTAINENTGSFTATFANAHPAPPPATNLADLSITTAQTQTLGSAYSGLVSKMALDLSTATTAATSQTNLASTINASRQSVDGINLDEETQNLLKYQNAYQAAAQTINVINQMIQTAIGLGSATTA